MKKRSILFASTVAAMALAGSAAHAERGSDGELKILFWQAVSTLNPYLSGGTKEIYSSSMVIEPLARYDEKGEPGADAGERDPDGRQWRRRERPAQHDVEAEKRHQMVRRHAADR